MRHSKTDSDMFDDIERALQDIAAGRPVVVVDDADRENEGDLIIAAEAATTEWLAFMIRHTSGVVCVALPGEALDRLGLPPMVKQNEDPKCTAFSVSVDLRDGVTTGISAADRSQTIRALADPQSNAKQFTRPGHVFPLRARAGGVLERAGHTEAAVVLARLAGMRPAGALSEIVNEDGSMARLPDLVTFARRHQLSLISIEDLVAYQRRNEDLVRKVAETRLPTRHGNFRAVGYLSPHDGCEHVALVFGEIGEGRDVLVRVHSECLTGDTFASLRCDCGGQLREAMRAVAAEGRGVVLYLGGHEGRGIGLLSKLRAYELQDSGHDTVDANLALGLPADARDYASGARILADLGVKSIRLLTNNPAKSRALESHGIRVRQQLPLTAPSTPHNLTYLLTKRNRMGHVLDYLGPQAAIGCECAEAPVAQAASKQQEP
ncbi:bifunctional 3,4-dihydroxy-2-butanone-4-phosphate synthase/GTP cyclohydrolase II [Streptomyces collinus]|uniref:bifunctional 3,4-dihydroxy-2-butanone-4-phosphate synthase/GTP cyclohydrolase II n=1 Tax=Streptomyces collinus TaxID=42684 RepID=UPI0036B3D3E0